MKGFIRYFKKLHIWFTVNVLLLAAFFLLRTQRALMNTLTQRITMPFERLMGRLCALVPISVTELCYVLALLLAAAYLVRSAVLIARAEYKREVFYRRLMIAVNLLLSLYAAFCLLWGALFYADGFCEKSGVYPEPVAYDDLLRVTRYFAEQASLCADDVPRDADGVCVLSRRAVLDHAPSLYAEGMYDEFPFLRIAEDPTPKPVYFSRVLSAMDVTGVYSPFTGESNLNMDCPTASFPATVAHELAHRRGIASEQQCNFLAVLAATRSSDPVYRYSGWYLGYVHLSNALYLADPDAWLELRLSLPAGMDADLRAESAYWASFRSAVTTASNKTYDAMLRSYGDELGIQSYGAVVDLLVAYYK